MSVVAAMPTVMVKGNVALRSEFMKIKGVLHLTDKKMNINNSKVTAIEDHFLCCNFSPSFLSPFHFYR